MSNKRVPKRRFKQFKDDGEWEKKTLGVLGIFSSNGVNKKINIKENPAFLLNYMDVYNRREITNENKKELMFTTATQTQILNNNVLKDDVFFTPSSETADDIGRVMVIEEDLENVVYSYHLTRFRPNKNVFHTTFPNYLFESQKFRNQMILSAQGVQRFVLNRKNFEELNAYIPPVKEQKTLNDFFTKLDRMIELQEEKINKLKALKKSYLTDMFVGGAKSSLPRKRFIQFVDNAVWQKDTLGNITERFDNLRIPVTEKDRVAGNTPYYGANGILDYIKGYTHNGDYILLAEDGANDLSDYPIFNVSGKIWVNNHAHVISGNTGVLENSFLMFSLKTINMEQYLLGGSRYKLNSNVMEKITIFIPNIEEQKQIGRFFDQIDKLLKLQNIKLEKIKNVKKAYLEEMFVNI